MTLAGLQSKTLSRAYVLVAASFAAASCMERDVLTDFRSWAPAPPNAEPLRIVELEGGGPFSLGASAEGPFAYWLRHNPLVFVIGRVGQVPSTPTERIRFRPYPEHARLAPYGPDAAAYVEYDFYGAPFAQQAIVGTFSEYCTERPERLAPWTALSHLAEQGPNYYDAQAREVQVEPNRGTGGHTYYRRRPNETLVSGERALFLVQCSPWPCGDRPGCARNIGWKFPVSEADEVDFSSFRTKPWSWPDRTRVPLARVMDFIRNDMEGWATWTGEGIQTPDAGGRGR